MFLTHCLIATMENGASRGADRNGTLARTAARLACRIGLTPLHAQDRNGEIAP